jgi:hypothetical protein
MGKISVDYRFSQRFKAPASEVFAWAIDYDAQDLERMGVSGTRSIARLCESSVVLTDTVVRGDGTKIRKKKLVRIDPGRMRWTNTHLAGPLLHSQFFYEIVPEGESACRLDFTGLQLEEIDPASKKAVAARARELRREDSALWKNLARAFAAERKQQRD